jgi:hypothetical protein
MEEIWKDIKGFEGHYKISNLGRVKSFKLKKEKILIQNINSTGYYNVSLCLNGIKKNYPVHQLVAKSFLNYIPDPYKIAVNHINVDRLDNRLVNLEIITHRKNCNKAHLSNSSKFVGVYIHKSTGYKYFVSRIVINKKQIHLGMSKCELKMSLLYNIALDNIKKYDGDNFKFRKFITLIYDTR